METSENPCYIFCATWDSNLESYIYLIFLGHSKLDELLQDHDLVNEKRSRIMAKPRRIAIGPICPICDVKDPAREHVAR